MTIDKHVTDEIKSSITSWVDDQRLKTDPVGAEKVIDLLTLVATTPYDECLAGSDARMASGLIKTCTQKIYDVYNGLLYQDFGTLVYLADIDSQDCRSGHELDSMSICLIPGTTDDKNLVVLNNTYEIPEAMTFDMVYGYLKATVKNDRVATIMHRVRTEIEQIKAEHLSRSTEDIAPEHETDFI